MSSKDQKPSKKAVREKKERAIEDATFGLKNKNKSKKVQQFINRVEKSVKNQNGGVDAARAKELKKENKLAQQLQEEELRKLFNEGIANQFGKKKSTAQAKASALGLADQNKEVAQFLEDMSSEESDLESDDGRNDGPIYIEADEPVATVIFREKTIEDLIEEQRAKLSAEGKKGTPVTEASFQEWRKAKLARKQAEAEARLKLEQAKKKGGKGLSVLSGKELFTYNASLFVDDEGAIDESEEKAMNEDMIRRQAAEEQRAKEEEERIQAEQQRLMELQQIELEARRYKDELRRQAAAAPNRATFVMGDVVINQAVFEEEEDEDLAPFPEETLVDAPEEEGEHHYATEAASEELIAAYLEDEGSDEGEGAHGDGEAEGSDGEEGDGDGEDSDDEEGDGEGGPGTNGGGRET